MSNPIAKTLKTPLKVVKISTLNEGWSIMGGGVQYDYHNIMLAGGLSIRY